MIEIQNKVKLFVTASYIRSFYFEDSKLQIMKMVR